MTIIRKNGLPRWYSSKESACQGRTLRFDPSVGKIPWSRKWQATPAFLPGKSHGQRSPVDYSPWGHKELDTAEHACTHTKCMYNKMIRRSLKLRAKENRHYDKWLASWLKTG